jgi:peptide deformylase
VTRSAAIRVAYQDAKGQRQEQDFEGLEAACVQHEIDHLNGVLIWDYIGMTRRSVMQRKLKKLLKERALEAQEAQ